VVWRNCDEVYFSTFPGFVIYVKLGLPDIEATVTKNLGGAHLKRMALL
jgi:hypothetical protein